MALRSRAIFTLARVLAAVLGTLVALAFLFSMFLPPAEAHPFSLAVGAVAGVLLYFARTGSRSPWHAAFFLPGLYLVQIPAIHLALFFFPHHRSIHCLFSLGASVFLMLAVIGARRVRKNRPPPGLAA
jgi:hypothetical protein